MRENRVQACPSGAHGLVREAEIIQVIRLWPFQMGVSAVSEVTRFYVCKRNWRLTYKGGQGRFPLLERAMEDGKVKYSQAGWRGGEHRETVWGRVGGRPGECGLHEGFLPPSRKNLKHGPGSICLVLQPTLTHREFPGVLQPPLGVVRNWLGSHSLCDLVSHTHMLTQALWPCACCPLSSHHPCLFPHSFWLILSDSACMSPPPRSQFLTPLPRWLRSLPTAPSVSSAHLHDGIRYFNALSAQCLVYSSCPVNTG